MNETPASNNPHGDRYPAAAAALAAHLPKRVTPRSRERTVGVARIGNRELPAMSSGFDPVWSVAAQHHLESLDINPELLQHHVEIKLAANQPFERTYGERRT